MQDLLEVFFLLQPAQQAYEEGQRRGLATGLLNKPEDVLADKHLIERRFFAEVDVNGIKAYFPKSPIRTSRDELLVLAAPPRLATESADKEGS